MIDLPSVAPPGFPLAPIAPGAVTNGVAGGDAAGSGALTITLVPGPASFGLALGAMLAGAANGPPVPRTADDRQPLAEGGTTLPEVPSAPSDPAVDPAVDSCAIAPWMGVVPTPVAFPSSPPARETLLALQAGRDPVPRSSRTAEAVMPAASETASPVRIDCDLVPQASGDPPSPQGTAKPVTPQVTAKAAPASFPVPNTGRNPAPAPLVHARTHGAPPARDSAPRTAASYRAARAPVGGLEPPVVPQDAPAVPFDARALPVAASLVTPVVPAPVTVVAPGARFDFQPILATAAESGILMASSPPPVPQSFIDRLEPVLAVPLAAPRTAPTGDAATADVAATLAPGVGSEVAPAIVVSAVPQPARAVFAAAIAAATGWRERAAKSAPTDPVAVPLGIPVEIAARPPVQPGAAMPDTALDLGTDRGLRQVIDRIGTLRDDLRDASDTRDTRIRLVPDRLGGVEIAVRREGDTVRVHFTAEREATRALLVDTQPRLTALAAERGVRIAEASVSTGTAAQQDAPAQPRPQPARSVTNTAAARAEAPDSTDDTRLA